MKALPDQQSNVARKVRTARFTVTDKKAQKIWLLDDDRSVIKSISRLLASAGWNSRSFTDVARFLERARIDPPDVVILDVLMPAMNGLEVQRRLQTISPSTRVIILTSKDDPIVRTTALNAGACAFLTKGGSHQDLLAGIASAL